MPHIHNENLTVAVGRWEADTKPMPQAQPVQANPGRSFAARLFILQEQQRGTGTEDSRTPHRSTRSRGK
jgi:hypothetical protein